MSASIEAAELAASVASSLCNSGIDAIPDLDEAGGAWIALTLDADTVAWLDVGAGMTYALTIDRAGTRRLMPHGPLADIEACADGRCVASQVLTWVIAHRAGASR
ncbi:MAG: hypothetical protein NVV70_03680 [Cellulomonas sp.]|nr:hypothetical protein [Cellulomonas sp.]MCR6647268.1 hypothetical protein [Cellulomonas sp.]